MSYPVFKDFDKGAAGLLVLNIYHLENSMSCFFFTDIIDEDFSTKYTLKIKSAGPSNTVSNNQF